MLLLRYLHINLYLKKLKKFNNVIAQGLETGEAYAVAADSLASAVKEAALTAGGERGRMARARLAALLSVLPQLPLQARRLSTRDKMEKVSLFQKYKLVILLNILDLFFRKK